MKQYLKAKQRAMKTSGKKDISDAEIIERLENEIEYYRHKIELLTNVHRENVECINKHDELIKEYQKIFKDIVINDEDILKTRTLNQIRKLLGFEEIKYDYDFNNEINNKQDVVLLNNASCKETNEDIEEIITTNMYAEGKVIRIITDYKYKSNEEAE